MNKNLLILIFTVLWGIGIAGCGSTVVEPFTEPEPIDSNSHKYVRAMVQATYSTIFGEESAFIVDSTNLNYVEVDTALQGGYIRLHDGYTFLLPMLTECGAILHTIDLHLRDIPIGKDPLELTQSPESGNGVRLDATEFSKGGTKPRPVVYESGRNNVKASVQAMRIFKRKILCTLVIEIPCDDDKPGHDSEKSYVSVTYTITY